MTEAIINEAVEVIEGVEAPEEAKVVVAELVVRVLEDGGIEVNIPEGGRELQSFEVETITRSVYEQLRDTRIASQAVSMFKAKLG